MSFFLTKKFSLPSSYFENVSSVANTSPFYRDVRFTITINDFFKIEIPQIVACSISRTVTNMVKADQTSTDLQITIKSSKDIRSSLEKIRRCVVSHESVSIDDDDKLIFGEFGILIGNNDFAAPMRDKLSREYVFLSVENVLNSLITKQKFSIKKTNDEIEFIARNFESMRSNSSFVEYCSDPNNIDTVEEILDSSELKLSDEDSLASFILCVCRASDNNDIVMRLFEKVLFEYCSSETYESFLSFVNEIVSSPGVRSLIKCIGRRFSKSQIIIEPPFVEGRHEPLFEEVTSENRLYGILRREHKKDKVLMEASSINGNFTPYNLIDGNDENFFYSLSEDNSYFQASLKDGDLFIIKGYIIKGNSSNWGIQNWRLEGQRASDGEWILLDRKESNPLFDGRIRSFNVTCNDKLKSVKLTQEGWSTNNNHCLIMDSFDIFGTLYTQKYLKTCMRNREIFQEFMKNDFTNQKSKSSITKHITLFNYTLQHTEQRH